LGHASRRETALSSKCFLTAKTTAEHNSSQKTAQRLLNRGIRGTRESVGQRWTHLPGFAMGPRRPWRRISTGERRARLKKPD